MTDTRAAEEDGVAAAQAGDRRALDSLLRTHYDRLYAVCRRLTGNDSDAADACQDALIAIVRNLHRFDGRSRFGTWSYRIAVNASLDELRRRRRRPRPTDDTVLDGVRATSTTDLSSGVVDRLVLDAALAELSPEFRAAVVLRDVAGLDYAEIATALDIPPGTVRSRIARGRAALADALGEPPAAPRTSKETP
ncbi:MAG: eukaryotic-like serine/threonine-protein kinase [Actinomycetota bacterium]